jgi:hypothetical protein
MRLDAAEIKRLEVHLRADEGHSVDLWLQTDELRFGLSDLIAFARRTQPEGTAIEVWYQGRSERIIF